MFFAFVDKNWSRIKETRLLFCRRGKNFTDFLPIDKCPLGDYNKTNETFVTNERNCGGVVVLVRLGFEPDFSL